jgi:tetratricopeptide (TPR) repeat protein
LEGTTLKALISGQVAVAVLIDGERYYSVNLDEPAHFTERQEFEVPLLLAEANDIQQLNDVTQSSVVGELQAAWEKDRGLQLVLLLLDSQEDTDTKISAADCLNDFLGSDSVQEYIANRLYSAPLPPIADLESAIRLSNDSGYERVVNFLRVLRDDQVEIERRYRIWNDLPVSMFGGTAEKEHFRFDAVRFGAFRLFATEHRRKNLVLVQLLVHPYFRGNAIARKVFPAWAAPFKESATGDEFERPVIEKDLREEIEEIATRERSGISRYEAFTQAEKQRNAIKQLLTEGDKDQALRFTDQLIASQRVSSEPEHRAKSLCDLAQFAKKIGSPELQLEFAKRAIEEAPTDAFSYGVVGDAYRALADYQKALDAYHQAGVFGDARASLLGRAHVFKDVGQISEALVLLEQCIQDNPGDIVAQNSRAAVLADYGRFNESLKYYDNIIEEALYDPVTLTGRAEVLRSMGRYDEALAQLDLVIALSSDNPVPGYTRGEILREMGNLEGSLRTFAELKQKFPLSSDVHAGYARVLRDLGQYDDAINHYIQLTKTHSFSPFGYIGLAESYKKVGNLDKAHEAYDVVLERFARSLAARNGKASIFMAQGRYSSAIELLPSNLPATYVEWVAYHIRGMGYMRSGKLQRAENVFDRGISEVPWAVQKQYFKTALASLRLQQKRFHESVDLVKDVISPAIKPIAQVVSMHALGELGDISAVKDTYQGVSDNAAPIVVSLREVMASRYLSGPPQRRAWSDSDVFIRECDALLLAA